MTTTDGYAILAVIGIVVIFSPYFIGSIYLVILLVMGKLFTKWAFVTLTIISTSLFPFIHERYRTSSNNQSTPEGYIMTCIMIVLMIVINDRIYNSLIITLVSMFLICVWRKKRMMGKKTKFTFTLAMLGLMIYFNNRIYNSIISIIECMFLMYIWRKKDK